ncbi:hypothetical protein BHE74_00015666 [Ensete ventricosum]|nr:hypothetical protein GW17_00036166 [Ensete ventricosum]RWW76256.1 hypothetical protein BHE74_00015666 [Ensete ventricosum]RZR96382.1 hypothetical protein BHM03_00025399 [Ensete ventricosum]
MVLLADEHVEGLQVRKDDRPLYRVADLLSISSTAASPLPSTANPPYLAALLLAALLLASIGGACLSEGSTFLRRLILLSHTCE